MYKIVEHTADVALAVSAKDLASLFRDAAAGFGEVVFEDSTIHDAEAREIELSAIYLEELLILWLSELNYLLTVHKWVFRTTRDIEIKQIDRAEAWQLKARIGGEQLNHQRHYIYSDIKAVTYHQMKIEESGGRLFTKVVFDI